MITIEKNPLEWYKSTFHSVELRTAFLKKYKAWSIKIKIEAGFGILINAHKESELLANTVADWSSAFIHLQIHKDATAPSYLSTYKLRQPNVLCSSIELSPPSSLNEEVEPLICDLLYLMGYTNLFISVKDGSSALNFKDRGYTPYMHICNRRTNNYITLYSKTLK